MHFYLYWNISVHQQYMKDLSDIRVPKTSKTIFAENYFAKLKKLDEPFDFTSDANLNLTGKDPDIFILLL